MIKKNLPKVSIVIPAKNEEATISMVYKRVDAVMDKIKTSYEIIFVDDGSTDNTYQEMKKLNKKYPKKIAVVKHRGNWGKSIALQSGFNLVRGVITITMDADLQDTPEEIPNFIKKIEEGYDLVSGWKKIRHDPISKTLPSKLGNKLASFLTGVKLHDFNCGFKAYKSQVVKNLNLYGELYKFIPIIASKQNYKIAEIAHKAEVEELGIKGGWQDQYAAVTGGFNFMEFNKDKTIIYPLRLKEDVINELNHHILLCYVGKSHFSAEQQNSLKNNIDKNEGEVINGLNELKEIALGIKDALLKNELNKIGYLLAKSWDNKKKLSKNISNSNIDRLYEIGLKNGALGGKLLGSGKGGYILFFYSPKKRNQLRRELENNGGDIMDFNFESSGIKIWKTQNKF